MANEQTFQLGVTNVVVGLSALTQVIPSRGVNGWMFKVAGGGTLAIANGSSAANGFSTGYVLGAGEVVSLSGPATFFLACAGATTTVSAVASYSAGYSLYP